MMMKMMIKMIMLRMMMRKILLFTPRTKQILVRMSCRVLMFT